MRPVKMLVRDLLLLAVTLLLYRASHQLDPASLFHVPLAVAAGAMIAFVGYLGHEWGHLLGAWARRSQVQVADSVFEIFLFKYDVAHNSRRQFLAMSAGGFIASGLAIVFLLLALQFDRLADQIALALTVLGVIATVVLELPTAWRVYRGQPLPQEGPAYVSEVK